jgi:hypothetical protein
MNATQTQTFDRLTFIDQLSDLEVQLMINQLNASARFETVASNKEELIEALERIETYNIQTKEAREFGMFGKVSHRRWTWGARYTLGGRKKEGSVSAWANTVTSLLYSVANRLIENEGPMIEAPVKLWREVKSSTKEMRARVEEAISEAKDALSAVEETPAPAVIEETPAPAVETAPETLKLWSEEEAQEGDTHQAHLDGVLVFSEDLSSETIGETDQVLVEIHRGGFVEAHEIFPTEIKAVRFLWSKGLSAFGTEGSRFKLVPLVEIERPSVEELEELEIPFSMSDDRRRNSRAMMRGEIVPVLKPLLEGLAEVELVRGYWNGISRTPMSLKVRVRPSDREVVLSKLSELNWALASDELEGPHLLPLTGASVTLDRSDRGSFVVVVKGLITEEAFLLALKLLAPDLKVSLLDPIMKDSLVARVEVPEERRRYRRDIAGIIGLGFVHHTRLNIIDR